jgi:hypothetical protein
MANPRLRLASALLSAAFVAFAGGCASTSDQDPRTQYDCVQYPKDVRCRS